MMILGLLALGGAYYAMAFSAVVFYGIAATAVGITLFRKAETK